MPFLSFAVFILEIIFGSFVIIASGVIALNIKNHSHSQKQAIWVLLPCFVSLVLLLFVLHGSIGSMTAEIEKISIPSNAKKIRTQ